MTSRADILKQAEPLPLGSFVIAADETQANKGDNNQDSAKMGEDEGTHVGDEQGSAPENDTQKIDQPARKNPTTSNAPSENSEDQPQ